MPTMSDEAFVPRFPLSGPYRLSKDRSEDGGIVSVRYHLEGEAKWEKNAIAYGSWPMDGVLRLREVQLANWDRLLHSYQPAVRVYEREELFEGRRLKGPIFILEREGEATLIAYEHGSDDPDAFLELVVTEGNLELLGTRGDHLPGEGLPWESVPLLMGTGKDADEVLRNLRARLWHGPSLAPATRKPLVTYNTWNRQERLRYFEDRPYLDDLNLARILREIDAAHRLGVDVFVIDTGWYAKTGDWRVNLERFPDGLKEVRARLHEHGMRLGLWFDPLKAARSSDSYQKHPEWRMSSHGVPAEFHPVWETEESTAMCLCTDWADHFADELIRLHREVGVDYFKWDGVGQYGCDAPGHGHGDERHSAAERRDRYAYRMGERFEHVVRRLLAACPQAVVDFDVTERGRYFGLGFLRYGRFFHINNGPYFADFDIPAEHKRVPETINVFFNPGPARSRVCRVGAAYDPFIPSNLLMTNFMPDGPEINQANAVASLALGGGSVWGDLCGMPEEDSARFAGLVARYKAVAEDAANAYPVVSGDFGSSPEIHDKLDPATSRGFVAFFTANPGRFVHVTRRLEKKPSQVEGADSWEALANGRVRLQVDLPRNGARLVTFA